MNKEEAIKQFVKNNFNFLTSNEFSRKTYKDKDRAFFYEKHKNKYGRPASKEVMLELVKLLKASAVPPDEIKNRIKNLPFFKEASNSTLEELYKIVSAVSYKSSLNDDQLKTMKNVGAFEAVRVHKGKEIEDEIKEELKVITEQIENKRTEFDTLDSILESEEKIEEPKIEPEAEEVKQWWERFYLKENPFPRTDGLSRIPEDLYERIIIKTKPFQETLNGLAKNTEYLFATGFLLVGGYGYGKSTFIDYLSYCLINKNIIPIRIICTRSFGDSRGFADSFFHELKKELKDEAEKMTTLDKEYLEEMEIVDQIIELSTRIISAQKDGIIIFLDDYHKHDQSFIQIFKFLGTLQSLKDKLTRKELNVGFIVSGLPEWKDELSRNSQLAGFLDNTPIEIPESSADLICNIFNRRIEAFCYESTPRHIKPSFVQRLVQKGKEKVGVRDYLNIIVEELSRNNQSIVDSPIEIPEKTLSDIKRMWESNSAIKSSFNKLLQGSKFKKFSKRQIAKCLELMVHVDTHSGISEEDKQFRDNMYYFDVLRNNDLIQKKLTKRSGIMWILRERLLKAISSINDKYGYNIQDYLLKIYAYKDYDAESTARLPEETNELTRLKQFINKFEKTIEKSTYENIKTGLRKYDSLVLTRNRFTDEALFDITTAYYKSAIDALQELSQALFELDTSSINYNKTKIRVLSKQWMLHPLRTESIKEAFHRINDYNDDETKQKRSAALRQIKNVLPEIGELIITILESRFTSDFTLLNRPLSHTDKEISIFRDIRRFYYSSVKEDHFKYVKDLTDHLEIKFRKFLFFTTYLLFGEDYFNQCPKDIRGYAHKNVEGRTSYAIESNMYDGLTRSQYKKIFLTGNKIRDLIIKQLDLTWKESDWETFCNVFATVNIRTSHQQIDVFSPTHRQQYLRYSILAEELLAAINTLIANYIQTCVYICKDSDTSISPEDCLFRSSIRKPQITPEEGQGKKVFDLNQWPEDLVTKKPIEEHALTPYTYERVIKALEDKLENIPEKIFIQDLLDTDFIMTHYRVNMADFIHCLAYSKYVSKDLIIEPWFGSSIAIKRTVVNNR